MKSSPFHDAAAESGARFQSYGGLELPEKFADAMKECEAVRAAAGLFDLSFRARLRLTGSERAAFLHNLTSNDVLSLAPGAGRYATILTDQSKVVADANVLALEDAMLVDLDARFLEAARAHLERYLVADDVEIEDLRETETTLGIAGTLAADVLGPLVDGGDLPPEPLAHRTATIGGAQVRIVRTTWTGEPGFDVFVACADAPALWRAIRDGGAPAGLVPAGMFAFNVLRVEAGVPWVGVDFDSSMLVLEAALDAGISYTKGCYLGQETVERIAARGHVNRRRVGFRIESDRPPRAGATVTKDGEEVGRVTSAVWSPKNGAVIGFAIVKREATPPGTPVEIAGTPAAIT